MNHTIEEYRSAIMKIFDEFYEMLKYYDKSWIQVITEENVPKEMLTGEIDVIDFHGRKMELKTWKYIFSDISDKEIIELEKKLGITLPNPLKAYYTSYFHLFDFQRNLSANSPINRMEGIYSAYNRYMIQFGYIPFTWDCQGGCIFCMKVDDKNNDCGIYKIDHEEMFHLEYHGNAIEEEIKSVMQFVSDDFLGYFRKISIEQIEEFIELGI